MSFSIIIPTYKRDQDLEECLKSIRENSSYRHEIIVLYDMNEGTKTVCDRYDAVSIFDEARKDGKRVKSLWAILNKGIHTAKNDYILYLNDDCLVMPGWDRIAEKYFREREKTGLLILRTKGIGGLQDFRIIGEPFCYMPCANYAVLNRKAGIYFDESFSWYYGDGDLPLQFAAFSDYEIVCTDENMIIHNHRQDASRQEHDAALFRNQKDRLHYFMKWAGYRRNELRLYRRNPFFCMCLRVWYGVGIILETPLKYVLSKKEKIEFKCQKNPWFHFMLSPVRTAYHFFRFVRAECNLQKNKKEYRKQCGRNELFSYHYRNNYTCLYDYLENAGSVNPHYFFQDMFAANQVFSKGIKHIYDIGSRLDGYITHLLSMGIHVTMIDIRPLSVPIDGLDFLQGNATSLEEIEDGSIPCISSLHALEHFGLGRYGDPVDYEGWKKALHAMIQKLKPGGLLFLSVPVGNKNLLMYNAHRIFRPVTIYEQVEGTLTLQSFTVVKDYRITTTDFPMTGGNVKGTLDDIADRLGKYDCGIFIFIKNKSEKE